MDRKKPAASRDLQKVEQDLPDPAVYCLRRAVRYFSFSMRNMVKKNKFRFSQFPAVTSLGCMGESVFESVSLRLTLNPSEDVWGQTPEWRLRLRENRSP